MSGFSTEQEAAANNIRTKSVTGHLGFRYQRDLC